MSSSSGNQSPSILLFLAHGTEEIEFSTCYDVFVRAGFSVTSVFVGTSSTSSSEEKASEEESTSSSSGGGDVHSVPFAKLSRGLKVIPDLALSDLSSSNPSTDSTSFSAIVVPGGATGAETISNNESIQKLIAKYYADGKVVAAICAGSLAVKRSGIGQDSQVTSHPSVKGEFEKGMCTHREGDRGRSGSQVVGQYSESTSLPSHRLPVLGGTSGHRRQHHHIPRTGNEYPIRPDHRREVGWKGEARRGSWAHDPLQRAVIAVVSVLHLNANVLLRRMQILTKDSDQIIDGIVIHPSLLSRERDRWDEDGMLL